MSLLPLPALPDNAAELRLLYRAAEARAARLRVLAEAGQALAGAPHETLDDVAARLAVEAAHLAGFAHGRIAGEPVDADDTSADSLVLPLREPGRGGAQLGALVLEDRRGDLVSEDREALGLLCQMIGASLSARAREQRLVLLLGELLRSQETERTRIAHELHDGVAQSAAALMRRLELVADGDPADLAMARNQAHALVGELRQAISGMRPPVLDDLGLVPALHHLAGEAEHSGLTIGLDIALTPGTRPQPAVETALFRLVQEALNNIRAHAGPGARAAVRLEQTEGGWKISVRDDGCGFDPAAPRLPGRAGGLGLAFMRERIELLGGWLTIASAPGAGCTLLAELPQP
jgi:signal transduction histidine kinase